MAEEKLDMVTGTLLVKIMAIEFSDQDVKNLIMRYNDDLRNAGFDGGYFEYITKASRIHERLIQYRPHLNDWASQYLEQVKQKGSRSSMSSVHSSSPATEENKVSSGDSAWGWVKAAIGWAIFIYLINTFVCN